MSDKQRPPPPPPNDGEIVERNNVFLDGNRVKRSPDSKANWKEKTIWTGDNLIIMRRLNSACVDMAYLDPPFNSKRNYAAPIGSEAAGAEFKDIWTLNDIDKEWIALLKKKHEKLYYIILTAMTNSDKSYLAYMAPRLLEIKRILKEDGSVYLHCDPTMSHYLKLMMDAIFGVDKYLAEITWKRNTSHNDSQTFGNIKDTILFYGTKKINVDAIRVPLEQEYINKTYIHDDKDGRGPYASADLTAKGLSGGGYYYDFHGHDGPWRYPEHRMLELKKEKRIRMPTKKNGIPRFKRYLKDVKGKAPSNLWLDIPPLQGGSKEKTGFRTQKPEALLRRIIRASSDKGDIVFDPFCGCATTLVVADDEQRDWIGIDISPKAVELVKKRIKKQQGLFKDIVSRDDIPQRTDLGKLLPPRSHFDKLYGEQRGKCNGCETHFEDRHLEVDHVIAKAKGGTDHIDNLQLLCSACNRKKGDRGQEYLIQQLKLDKKELGL